MAFKDQDGIAFQRQNTALTYSDALHTLIPILKSNQIKSSHHPTCHDFVIFDALFLNRLNDHFTVVFVFFFLFRFCQKGITNHLLNQANYSPPCMCQSYLYYVFKTEGHNGICMVLSRGTLVWQKENKIRLYCREKSELSLGVSGVLGGRC